MLSPQRAGEREPLDAAARRRVEERTQALGRELLERLPRSSAGPLTRTYWDERLMALSMRSDTLKTRLFRFVDVLPALRDPAAVAGHLEEYLSGVEAELPSPARFGYSVARKTGLTRGLLAKAAVFGTSGFARKFIAGSNVQEAVAAARKERRAGRCFTFDILGEAVVSQKEADGYFSAYADLIRGVAEEAAKWPDDPRLDESPYGRLPRSNLSIKLSALDPHFDAIDFDGTKARVGSRLAELFRIARDARAFINVDMESYEKKDLTLAIFKDVLSQPEFAGVEDVGIVIQRYLKESDRDLAELRQWAADRGTPVWVRLVKGAYWDYETVHALAMGWDVPVYQQKSESDASFERASRYLLQHAADLRPAFGSHNLRSLAYAMAVAEELGLSPGHYEIQMLYGMADAEKEVLTRMGRRVRVYMPYGELIPGMAYLVRRLLENTANDSFVRVRSSEKASAEELFRDPATVTDTSDVQKTRGTVVPRSEGTNTMPTSTFVSKRYASDFINEPAVDFTKEANRQRMTEALAAVRQSFGRFYPLVIAGEEVATDDRMESRNPSNWSEIVGTFNCGNRDHVERAVRSAHEALPKWSGLGAKARGDFLRRAAERMRSRKLELAAWTLYECGKPWREATADVDEAIDFCNFYAREAEALEDPAGGDVPGEENRFLVTPRGVTAVISPWNFPLAILTGMTTAALATGNTVVMKPAEQSSVVAAKLMEIFREAGLPPGVVHYLPGRGEEVGAALVEHPLVALIAFTGSRQVGLAINAQAAQASTRHTKFVKKVIAEMGGKNAVIIDDDADLDEAIQGVTKSAFWYAGQKCSACSRLIVLSGAYEPALERLRDATLSLPVGPADDPATLVGPLIDRESQERLKKYAAIGREEGRQIVGVDVGELAERGCFVGPHIFADVSPEARIMQEEIFGPVLAVTKANSLDEAFRIANGTDYALTGGVYSRSPRTLERARREFLVGNLYLNRNITGAMVGRQPFGGFKMSGIGSKAGGKDYLLQFVVPRAITENTLRRGFAAVAEDGTDEGL
ncbi:MAG TPA: proline dehydrogenase family protein [Pirellulaceae bacterium]|jgi:RHH-type proline utilization regulon transcriptional repressor/proline dehydrogenase/delta 1-pyrroline-5-carboxylate dehydrogenase|nr:proline dehydrogenase family protein [Pirellulaceae bacterium]